MTRSNYWGDDSKCARQRPGTKARKKKNVIERLNLRSERYFTQEHGDHDWAMKKVESDLWFETFMNMHSQGQMKTCPILGPCELCDPIGKRKSFDDLVREDEECYVTFEQTCVQLESIEKQIALELGLDSTKDIRQELINLSKNGELVETELVSEWHMLYSSYVNFKE